jgi:hypothetical protein
MNKMLVLVPLVLISGCVSQQPIGGQTDEYGCLGPAGYSWDSSVGACTRSWELDDVQRNASRIAVGYAGYRKPTTVVNVTEGNCAGCFNVTLQQGENRDIVAVQIENWTAQGKTATRHTCTEQEKNAQACTLEYLPVCGYKSDGTYQTYGNGCGACSDKADYWEFRECPQSK